MPAQEGRRRHEEGGPALPWDDPTRRREEDPIDGPKLRWTGLPTENPELMVEDEDLEVLRALVPATMVTADEETHEGADDEVEERPHRPIVPGLSERDSGFPIPTAAGWLDHLPWEDQPEPCRLGRPDLDADEDR